MIIQSSLLLNPHCLSVVVGGGVVGVCVCVCVCVCSLCVCVFLTLPIRGTKTTAFYRGIDLISLSKSWLACFLHVFHSLDCFAFVAEWYKATWNGLMAIACPFLSLRLTSLRYDWLSQIWSIVVANFWNNYHKKCTDLKSIWFFRSWIFLD